MPLPATAGFIRLTKQKYIRSFLLACMLLVVMSLFPSIIRYLASLPPAVASAVLMASFVQLIGIGLNNIKQVELNERNVTILGVAVLFGSGVMFYRLGRSSPAVCHTIYIWKWFVRRYSCQHITRTNMAYRKVSGYKE